MKTLNVLLAVSLFLVFTGCSAGGRGSLKSYTAEAFPVAPGSAVVNDLAERLQASYPPGRTVIYLSGQDGSGQDGFGAALENKLRGLGFTVVSAPESGAITVTWTVDELEPGFWYLLARLSDGRRLARVYADNGLVIKPAGSLSQGKF